MDDERILSLAKRVYNTMDMGERSEGTIEDVIESIETTPDYVIEYLLDLIDALES